MAYTPELNKKYSAILRRIAWSMGMPMTKTIEHVFDKVVPVINSKMVCDACKDRRDCDQCVFTQTKIPKQS